MCSINIYILQNYSKINVSYNNYDNDSDNTNATTTNANDINDSDNDDYGNDDDYNQWINKSINDNYVDFYCWFIFSEVQWQSPWKFHKGYINVTEIS